MVRKNNVLANIHLRKPSWQLRVRTWLNQPGRKLSRRNARAAKAAKVAPRPTSTLKPVVRCPTNKYNIRVRAGRGFTLQELQAAGVNPKYAKTVGIAVDFRRRNRCQESLDANVQRLKNYMDKLIVFPRVAGKPKNGDCTDEEALKSATQNAVEGVAQPENADKFRAASDLASLAEVEAYRTIRLARSNQRLAGIREKRKKDKEAAAALKKKK